MLVQLINRAGDGRLVAAGDSNVIFDSPLYHALIDGAGLTDHFDDAPTFFTRKGVDGSLDRLLLRGWGDEYVAEVAHMLVGHAIFPPQARDEIWTDHEGLRLTLKCRKVISATGLTAGQLAQTLSLIHISEPTRLGMISY